MTRSNKTRIMQILKAWYPSSLLEKCHQEGTLRDLIPPLYNCIGVEQGEYHNEDVYTHCLAVADFISPQRPYLRLAALLHDIGKPATKEIRNGRPTFYEHEVVGARLAYEFMKQCKFHQEACEYVSLIIRRHMWHFQYDSKIRTIRKWLKKVKGYEQDLLVLRVADRAGNRAKIGKPLITPHMLDLEMKVQEAKEILIQPKSDLRISGKDLIALGLEPGPNFGKILGALENIIQDKPELNEYERLITIVKTQFFEPKER